MMRMIHQRTIIFSI
jgi:hypothetical protein